MTERPIVFGADEVRALLSGNKTQMRRLADMRHVMKQFAECPRHDLIVHHYFGATVQQRED